MVALFWVLIFKKKKVPRGCVGVVDVILGVNVGGKKLSSIYIASQRHSVES